MIDLRSLIHRNRSGEAIGLPCFCTANEHALRAVMKYAAMRNVPAVIEATCNQVNQDGGYTGLNAEDFADWIALLAEEYRVSRSSIILGGDHLGPSPWRDQSAEIAMEKAEIMVRDYAAAGFRKIHLDASMACFGESTLSFEEVAERSARLCRIAEEHAPVPDDLIYVIGTEVPVPGGEVDDMKKLSITSVACFRKTIDTHRDAFERHGLTGVWPRIVSIVTQPGVDFSHTAVRRFNPAEAAQLVAAIGDVKGMIFEAHSTDYQPTVALSELVESHFFFLKVGPELTFRMREAVFSLTQIEKKLDCNDISNLINIVDEAMDEVTSNWSSYYKGEKQIVKQLRHYSYSDRIRYYWTVPAVRAALEKLMNNLDMQLVPETIVSQYFPSREFGDMSAGASQLVSDHVNLCIDRYYRACGY